LEPLSLAANFEAALALYFSRNYDQAINQFQKTLELDANFPPPYTFLGAAMSKRECLKKLSPRFKKLSALIKALPRYWLWQVWPTSMPRPAGRPKHVSFLRNCRSYPNKATFKRPTWPLSMPAWVTKTRLLRGWTRPMRSTRLV